MLALTHEQTVRALELLRQFLDCAEISQDNLEPATADLYDETEDFLSEVGARV